MKENGGECVKHRWILEWHFNDPDALGLKNNTQEP